jgi:TIR domain
MLGHLLNPTLPHLAPERAIMLTRVFLSYSSADYAIAEEVHSVFESVGLTVFDIRNLSVGGSWVRELDEAMGRVDVVVALVSSSYGNSATTSEWTAALAVGKRVVPVIIEHDARVPALLSPYVGIDASDPRTRSAKLHLIATQLDVAREGSLGVTKSEIDSVERRLTESRSRQSETLKLLQLLLVDDVGLRRRIMVLIFLPILVLMAIVVVGYLVLSPSVSGSLELLIPALSATLGVIFGWVARRERGRRDPGSHIDTGDMDPALRPMSDGGAER